MVYITVRQSPIYRKMSLEEYIFQNYQGPAVINENMANTRTYALDSVSEHFKKNLDVDSLIQKLDQFNSSTDELRQRDRSSLYYTFHIPKRSGGLRRIDAPQPELMNALRQLKTIFEEDFHSLYHTAAFAYVKGRCTIDAVKRHQQNESKWFAKLDLHNFFGSTSMEFVLSMLSMIYPFSEVVKISRGRDALSQALDLAFLNGGLPQGTPISPTVTNIMMIPIDFELSKTFRDHNGQRFIYTRYADDFTISSRYDFDVHMVEDIIVDTLKNYNAPFTLNNKKTRYGSSAGRNWNLGVMLNKDNQITVGHKKKRQLQSMLYNYITDKRNNVAWDKGDVQTMQGLISYYHMVEPENIDAIIQHMNNKMNTDVISIMSEDLH